MRVGYIVGSLSAGSINRKLVDGLVSLATERTQLRLEEIPIAPLGLYDRERDDAYPPEATAFKEHIRACDGLLICTPEYNRSIPGVLKNAVDWASRPYGDNAFAGKPVGIIGASVGTLGTGCAQQHLRTILAYLDAAALTQPEAYIQFTDDRFDESGNAYDESTREFLGDWLVALEEWITRVGGRPVVRPPEPGAPSDNTTMTEIINSMEADGFGQQFVPRDDGRVECAECHTVLAAGDLEIAVTRRLEGASDPADMSTVYAARCPSCGTGGTLVVGFGVNASPADAEVIRQLAHHG